MPSRRTLIDRQTGPMRATGSQTLIWAGQALDPDSPLYNMAWRFDLHRAIDPTVFQAAFAAVVQASDAMRMVFEDTGGTPIARCLDTPPSALTVIDFSSAPDPDGAIAQWVETSTQTAFDLSASNYRSALIKRADEHWVWFLNQHHIASDASASALIFRAVSDAYEALETGQKPALDLPPFAHHADREVAARSDPAFSSIIEHWETTALEAPPLPTPYGATAGANASASDHPRASTSVRKQVPFGKARTVALNQHIAAPPFRALSPDLARFAIFATAFAAYRARVTGDTRVTIGIPAHNRATLEDRKTIGLYIDVLPLTLAVEDTDTFTSLHARTMASIQTWLRHARPGAGSAAAASAFSAILNYIPVTFSPFAGSPARIEWRHPGAHDAAQDMRLHVFDFEGTGTLEVHLDLNTSVFTPDRQAAAVGHVSAMLGAMLDAPDTPIQSVRLTDADEDATIARWEAGPVTTQPPTLPDAFADQVARTPDAIAVRCGEEQLSYAALDAASNRFAQTLLQSGTRPGDRVIVHMRRSLDLFPVLMGVLRSGCAFVPVPSDTPPDRLSILAQGAAPSAVITDRHTRPALPDLGLPILDAETWRTSTPDSDSQRAPLPAPIDPETAAYLIFTSGSTGTPKGVTVQHGSIARYIDWARRSYTAPGASDFAVHSAIGFDLTLTSLFTPLISGGTAVVYPETGTARDLAVLDAFEADETHIVKLTPSHLAMVIEAKASVSTIQTLVLGGEAFSTALAQAALLSLSPTLRLFNEYGPTEAVVGCMIHAFDPETDIGGDVPIGRPADDSLIRIVDGAGNRVPVGVTGEIMIGGARLAMGYFGDPGQTTARFCPDPHQPGAHLYRSGDLARWDEHGCLHYLGRADSQLKVGGVRIEPGEIEIALEQIEGVLRAVVGLLPAAPPRRPKHDPVRCARCGLGDDYPGITLDGDRICTLCRGYDTYRDKAAIYFDTPDALRSKIHDAANRSTGAFDVAMLLSGGKDSTYALYQLHALTPRILALTLDNGFLSEGAMANIRRVCHDLGIEHRFLRTNAMNDIFVDSLNRHSNVCQGCFKAIYTLALETAVAEGVSAIVTGLSRGQFFETRLTPELFAGPGARDGISAAEIDRTVHEARKAYHRTEDAVTQCIDAPAVASGRALEQVEFIDIYRYIDVPLETLYAFLSERAPWIRPEDTGRSTNCRINDVGIYVHQRREGFHNYALPYSWDVRLGHKTRAEALAELDDTIDPRAVEAILTQIGFTAPISGEASQDRLVAWVTGTDELDPDHLRKALTRHLPAALIPTDIIRVEAIPTSPNGKTDIAQLPRPDRRKAEIQTPYTPPVTDTDKAIAGIWKDVLNQSRIGLDDNFYDLGGDSIAAIQIAAKAQAAGFALKATDMFERQTIRLLTKEIIPAPPAETTPPDDQPLVSLDETDLAALSKALGTG